MHVIYSYAIEGNRPVYVVHKTEVYEQARKASLAGSGDARVTITKHEFNGNGAGRDLVANALNGNLFRASWPVATVKKGRAKSAEPSERDEEEALQP